MNVAWPGILDELSPSLAERILQTQASLDWLRAASGRDLFNLACQELGLDAEAVGYPFDPAFTAMDLGNVRHADLAGVLIEHFPPGTGMAETLADQIQLCRAFVNPKEVTDRLALVVVDVIRKFPKCASDLRLGQNAGDVLDPFILSANFELLSGRDLTKTIEATTSHKVLMKIEDLLGNLHQSVIGSMRGNFRVPEPQGRSGDKETLDPVLNPFPGADVGQVPTLDEPDSLRLFQVKSKTGSAKGGDGKRLGDQLRQLEDTYGAHTFYAAVVGNTLRGHRSKSAVLKASPNTAVVVGEAALGELTQSTEGGELLLRVYERAFRAAAEAEGYSFLAVIEEIARVFELEAAEHGEDFLTAWLHHAIDGPRQEQDSRAVVTRGGGMDLSWPMTDS